MCGVSGWLSWERPPNPHIVVSMTNQLVHRGPDSGAVVDRGAVVLGHRRLSIIDLTKAGSQPMADHTGTVWIVFNGEIYNFPELRAQLEGYGHRFRTNSDTEVILEAYKKWGEDCLERLVGMFAFAIWDENRNRLLLARDRLGEKPLYFQNLVNGGLIFASEMKALRAHPEASSTVNPAALSDFLSLNYILSDKSILRGVEKLPAAHYLLFEKGRPPVMKQYWDLARHFREKRPYRSEAAAAEELAHHLESAVKGQLLSDVPLGAFLSGGIDSSAVVASMVKQRPGGGNSTFSLGFPERSYSELDWSSDTAAYLDVENFQHVFQANEEVGLERIVYFADEPFADTSIIPLYHLAAFARRHVTVCLSGDGADEILGGYETYVADRMRHATQFIPRSVTRALGQMLETLWQPSFDKVSNDYKIKQFLHGHGLDPIAAHYRWRTIFSDAEKRRMLRDQPDWENAEDGACNRFREIARDVEGCHYLDQAMYVDIKTWLVDDILTKVDRATMAHSLEARVPFLDHRLVEFAASLPVNWKLKGLRKKHLLKESQRKTLPNRVLNRKKRGFNAPVSHWFGGEFEEMAKSVTLDSGLTEWIDPGSVELLWKDHLQMKRDNGLKLFGLTCLGIWLNQMKNNTSLNTNSGKNYAKTMLLHSV
jgi:asparagine synthase (glutamine-hydrolysing)